MIRWCLKRIDITDIDGMSYQKDVRVLEFLQNEKWIEVPEVDERFDKQLDPNLVYPGKDPDFVFPEE